VQEVEEEVDLLEPLVQLVVEVEVEEQVLLLV
jgi:hypothetical protein